MIADHLYKYIKDYSGVPATWALRQIFRLHADTLRQMPEKRYSPLTATYEAKEADRCADLMREIGTEKMSFLRQWVPVQLPEMLEINEIADFRERLEKLRAQRRDDHGQRGPAPGT